MLERTRLKWKRRVQGAMFDGFGLKDLLAERERHALEDSMGFRGQWDEHRRFQIDELRKLGLVPSSKLIEIGCGPLTAGIPVIDYLDPGNYVGVDVRSSVLNLAWEQIGRAQLAGKNPRLVRSDSFGDDLLGDLRVDYAWSFSVLFHLADEILDGLFASISRRLAPDGLFIANVMVDMEASTWLEFPFLRRTVAEYGQVAAKHGLGTEDLGSIADRGFKLDGAERNNRLLRFTPMVGRA